MVLDLQIQQIILGVAIALASSFLGVFIILRKMALVSDVMSHVALPGIAIAMMFNVNPFLGAFLALFLAVTFIVIIEKKYQFSIETLVGVFFTASLALGMLLMGDDLEMLVESLFGDISKISTLDFWIGVIGSGLVFLITAIFFKKFTRVTFSKELSQSQGVEIGKIDYLFLILFALIIGVGIKAVGVLLMGALTILPVSIAKNFSRSLKGMTLWSLLVGVFMVVAGFAVSGYFNVSSSAIIILMGALFFTVSLFMGRK